VINDNIKYVKSNNISINKDVNVITSPLFQNRSSDKIKSSVSADEITVGTNNIVSRPINSKSKLFKSSRNNGSSGNKNIKVCKSTSGSSALKGRSNMIKSGGSSRSHSLKSGK